MSLQMAYALAREATAHKRLSQSHRRVAQRKLEELRQICDHLGLDFQEIRQTTTEGEHAHGRTDRTG